jgi:hypothetical protein
MPLPPHPFVPIRQVLKDIAERYVSSALSRRLFLLAANTWLSLARLGKHEERIRSCFERGENGYASQYLRFASLYYPEFSALCLLTPQPEEPLTRRAAKLIIGALRFRERALNDQLKGDFEGDKALDMQRYRHLFSRFTRALRKGGSLVHETVDVPPSEHVIVAIDAVFYKLQVLRDGQALPARILEEQLRAILADAAAQLGDIRSDRFPFGLFTVLQNQKTVAAFEKLREDSADSLRELENALFFLAIDLHDHPQSQERLGRVLHTRNPHNRDYRRSFQFVVTGNGRVGLIADPNAGIGGWFAARFLDEVAREGPVIDAELAEPSAAPAPPAQGLFQRLRFDAELLSRHQETLARVEKHVQERTYVEGYDTICRIERVGKKALSRQGLSVDGAFHAALHLAFRRCFGHVPEIGNFISLRSVQHGELFLYNSSTPEMKEFVARPGPETLVAALHQHKVVIKETKKATDPFYQLGMALRTMYNRFEVGVLRLLPLLLLLTLFVRNFQRRIASPNMWVSHIPELAGLALTARPGVKLSFMAPPSIAGHYMIFDEAIVTCFLSNPGRTSHCGQERRFAATLEACLLEVKELLGKVEPGKAEGNRSPGS